MLKSNSSPTNLSLSHFGDGVILPEFDGRINWRRQSPFQGSGRLPVQGPPDHLLSGNRCRTSLSLLAWYHGKALAQKRGLCRMCAAIQDETSSGTEESTGSMPASDRSRSFVAASLQTGFAQR
jgi:hypothetical protein